MLFAFAFIAVCAGLVYALLAYYFRSITDLALYHAMAHEYETLGLALPPELATSDILWAEQRKHVLPISFLANKPVVSSLPGTVANEGEYASPASRDDHWLEEAYDGELAAIFIIPIDPEPNVDETNRPPILSLYSSLPDRAALQVAERQGSDLRTVALDDQTSARLLTYRLPTGSSGAMLQLGRVLADQTLILRRVLRGTLGIGCVALLVSAVGSWWLAGRSLRPAQIAFERQRLFVANASHELRTPLTLIRASAEVVHDGLAADQENRVLLEDVIHEIDHMIKLVDDLLLLSRMDAGQLVIEQQRVSLSALLAEGRRLNAPLAAQRKVEIGIKQASGEAIGDPTRLHQVMLILIENAIQHTPGGGAITLEAGVANNLAWITVTDTGEGIPAVHLPRLFDRFYQVDSARNGAGTGLGLAIAKSLVEAQQGDIMIESEYGHGTTARLCVPAAPQCNRDF
ncbi:MAG TPA: ATP-binding protein [Caldilineaceae bacterium]|nr:ATP-binding protein [Caldilineaceae bacterium]